MVGWLTRHPDGLSEDEAQRRKDVLARCPERDVAAGHVASFAQMMTTRSGHALDEWSAAVIADEVPELCSFVGGLRRDHDAVVAGLTLEHSSGAVEGSVNRLLRCSNGRCMAGPGASCCAPGRCSRTDPAVLPPALGPGRAG